MEEQTLKQHRGEIYKRIEEIIGRFLTPDELKEMSMRLKEYARTSGKILTKQYENTGRTIARQKTEIKRLTDKLYKINQKRFYGREQQGGKRFNVDRKTNNGFHPRPKNYS